jgi:hypothetical protein
MNALFIHYRELRVRVDNLRVRRQRVLLLSDIPEESGIQEI